MGYVIQAIVGSLPILQARCSDFEAVVVAPLACGQALILLTDELLDEIGPSGSQEGFWKLSPAVVSWICSISESGPAAYIEAEYFGGVGEQSSVVWVNGKEVVAPTHQENAINIALRRLGVSRGASHDEFEAVGLTQHRRMEDWVEDASKRDR